MAKTVFRPGEIKAQGGEVVLKPIHDFAPIEVEAVEKEPEYTGPTADDLRKEAEEFKKNWEAEKQKMLSDARASADEIVKRAGADAQKLAADADAQKEKALSDARASAGEIVKNARDEAQKLVEDAKAQEQQIESDAQKKGFDEGREAGWKSGEDETNRLIERMRVMLEAIMNRREEILRETETQIVELVLLMTRKVVKSISENQKGVVAGNVLAALKKVKGRGAVTLRVNLADLKLATEHIGDFIKRVENIQGITVAEDSTVEQGGCIVETDFGSIDARIGSQLAELESKIMEISPITERAKINN